MNDDSRTTSTVGGVKVRTEKEKSSTDLPPQFTLPATQSALPTHHPLASLPDNRRLAIETVPLHPPALWKGPTHAPDPGTNTSRLRSVSSLSIDSLASTSSPSLGLLFSCSF